MPESVVSYAPMRSPIGRLWVAVSPSGLAGIARAELPDDLLADLRRRGHAGAVPDPDPVTLMLDELAAYFAGRLRRFSTALDLRGTTAFDAAVWSAVRSVPYGETVSYGEVAAMAGFPGAARAAGGSMARCPMSPVVPCHRVIQADGSMGGWGQDPWVKRWLLDLEREADQRLPGEMDPLSGLGYHWGSGQPR